MWGALVGFTASRGNMKFDRHAYSASQVPIPQQTDKCWEPLKFQNKAKLIFWPSFGSYFLLKLDILKNKSCNNLQLTFGLTNFCLKSQRFTLKLSYIVKSNFRNFIARIVMKKICNPFLLLSFCLNWYRTEKKSSLEDISLRASFYSTSPFSTEIRAREFEWPFTSRLSAWTRESIRL